MQTFSVVVDAVMLCLMQYPFYLWINVFCLSLVVGHSSPVPSKGKKGIKKNETAQLAGTGHEMHQEIFGL